MIPGKKYDPGTFTSRRPTPEKFAHLRKWVEEVKRSVKITSITEMTNINQQLEQNAELYISNIIQRVIAQLIGKYGDGFVTLEATEDGKLKVEATFASRTVLNKAISFSGAQPHTIITAVAGEKIKITNLMFTVAGEVNLTLRSDANALSGALDFGGTDEPRGMVQAFGESPLETAEGEAFKILASAAKQVSGYVTYFTE